LGTIRLAWTATRSKTVAGELHRRRSPDLVACVEADGGERTSYAHRSDLIRGQKRIDDSFDDRPRGAVVEPPVLTVAA
jgi:hypothetical protein